MEINPMFSALLPIVFVVGLFVIIALIYKVSNKGLRETLQRQAAKRGGYVEEKFYHFFPRLVIPYVDKKVIVYSTPGGKNSPPYTHLKFKFSSSKNIRLTVYKEGLFSKFGKSLGMQDLIVDDPTFDESFIIQGKDEMQVRQLLSSEVKEKLLTLVSWNMNLSINRSSVRLCVPSVLKTDTDCELFIDAGLTVVRKIMQLC